jgi:hypothetical protein
VLASHIPWISTLKIGEFRYGSMGFRDFSRARSLFEDQGIWSRVVTWTFSDGRTDGRMDGRLDDGRGGVRDLDAL